MNRKESAPAPRPVDVQAFLSGQVALSKGQSTQLGMLDVATQVVAEEGFDHLSYEAVARRLGVQRSQVQYHFAKIDDLVSALARLVIGTSARIVDERVAAASLPEARLEAAVRGPFEWARRYPHQVAVRIAIIHLGYSRAGIRDYLFATREAGLQRLGRLVAERAGLRPKRALELASAVQGLITGNLVDFVTCGKGGSLKATEDATWKAAKVLLGI
jgi:AcrR family transcriptional regulator